ncbi:hypothetical protein NC661_16555 [Aquibacillus koreensis]|uniref:Uncharacterized protein n=1 Tax=Aquibacillus koreensis TaxID=279446 RepID=A0A9X3WLP3_9BACI|nr:hypothetical protein [Aquibacillus koreensis]MCT2536883.1 hypothetical protein [Aquibacillus koreensis]MDC3421985.1 hypothetical protein [Aquibacillus koreensis]
MDLYEELVRVAKNLNEQLEITRLLFGSLGLEKVTGLTFDPHQDIDVLVPLTYLQEKWPLFKEAMQLVGCTSRTAYKMVCLIANLHDTKEKHPTVYNDLNKNELGFFPKLVFM